MLPSRLFVRGKGELKSQEQTTQGDPIAMGLYTWSITPSITAVASLSESMHHSYSNPFYNVAFSDDFNGCGKLESFADLVLSSDIMSILPRHGLQSKIMN